MKLHYSRKLLFALPLNIFVTSSSNVYNKNKPYITTRHIPIYTSRVFRKCDTQSSNYDKDADMKSVKKNFDRQTSQRFEEYEERMKVKRQKDKEQRDKNAEQIIEKDKMDKSLAEKGCLEYGCGLEGVAESVGLFGGLGMYGWKTTALAAAKKAAMVEGTAKGAATGVAKVIELINLDFGLSTLGAQTLETVLNVINYTNEKLISESIYMQYQSTCLCIDPGPVTVDLEPICISVGDKSVPELGDQGVFLKEIKVIETAVRTIVSKAKNVAVEALKRATEEVIKISTAAVKYIFASYQIAIIASVVAILVIVLVMVFIYLILRYRRKKRMNKKAKYTKLLNK
ncbi:rifin PIR protein, putative [Plasmodium reichenowi]|uniref:Rifin PIR protein, putative n=1 Tax=Plasmodium reichenowi TaxID=5854 RepID=A0A2P9D465_PLARE|nr:rifin PIR protein, putative [Plasmodium reichenowi]